MVSDICGKLHVVGDNYHGAALAGQILNDRDNLLFKFGVQRRGGFVK